MCSYDKTLERAETAVAIFRDLPSQGGSRHEYGDPGEDLFNEEWECAAFAGVGYSTAPTESIPSREWSVNLPNGEWFAVLRSSVGRRYVATSDPFGFSPLYVAELPKQGGMVDLYVSNSYPAIAAELPNTDTNIDQIYVASLLGSTSTLSQTAFSDATPDKRVKLVEQGRFLEITEFGWRVVSAPKVNDTYDGLIQRGVVKATRMLGNIASQLGPDDKVQLRLSGGRDSRAVLALLSATALLPKVEVLTVDPARAGSHTAREVLAADERIATYLRTLHGLPTSHLSPGYSFEISPHESLTDWQRHRSNFNFHFSPRNRVIKNQNRLFDIYGGAGETFRTHWAGFFRKHPRLNPTDWESRRPDEIAREVFRLVFPPHFFGDGLHAPAEERFIRDLSLEDHGDFSSAIDRHYVKYRNRGHNGSARSALGQNTYNVMPLGQKEFYEAALLLGREDREDGRVIFDLIEQCAPYLNSIEFESGDWPVHFGKPTDIYPKRAFENQTEAKKRHVESVNTNRVSADFEPAVWSRRQFQQIKGELRGVPGLDEALTPQIDRWLNHRFDVETVAGKGILISKLASIRDSLAGTRGDIRFETSLAGPELGVPISASRALASYQKSFVLRESLEPIAVEAHGTFDGSRLLVDAKVVAGQASVVEFAFYAFAGSERFHTRWYSKNGHLEVGTGDKIPTHVSVFARFEGAPDAFSTTQVEVRDVSARSESLR